MSASQALRHMQGVVYRFAHRQPATAQLLPQRFAFEQFTDEIRRAFVNSSVVNGEDVWMIERRERLRLLFEAPQPIRIADKILWQHLHGHVAIEPCVPCAKHFAHPARADGGGDPILVEGSANHSQGPRCSVPALICLNRIS